LAQEFDDFISPEKMRHHDRINVGVGGGVSQHVEADTTPWSLLGRDHATPFGSVTHDAFDMLRCGDECELL